MGSYNAKFDAELESIAKIAKSLAKKYIGRKVLQAVKGAFSLVIFLHVFGNFFNRFEISRKFCVFDTHVELLKEKMFFHIGTLFKF
jgi:hypothetical protein